MSDSVSATRNIDAAQIIESLSDGVLVVDQHERVVCWNSMAERISGYHANDILGHECRAVFLHNVGLFVQSNTEEGRRANVFLDGGQWREMFTYIRHRDGHLVPVLVKLSPIMRDDAAVATVALFTDMTPRAMEEPRTTNTPEKGEWVDPLTLLPSRLASTAQLRECFERWKLAGERFSVVLFSVRHEHNEQQHGARIKERIFVAIGKTLRGAVRHSDFAGRWIDELFIVLLPHCAQPQARNAGRRLLTLLQQTAISDNGTFISARVEFAVTSVRANDTPTILLQRLRHELRRKEQADQV